MFDGNENGIEKAKIHSCYPNYPPITVIRGAIYICFHSDNDTVILDKCVRVFRTAATLLEAMCVLVEMSDTKVTLIHLLVWSRFLRSCVVTKLS